MSRPIDTDQPKLYGKQHPDDRRSSLATIDQASSSSSATTLVAKENKRPLITVMSEDHSNASSSTPQTSGTNPASGAHKQSFLSKFARSEVKISKSIEKPTTASAGDITRHKATVSNSDVYGSRKLDNDQSAGAATPNKPLWKQCDRVPITTTTSILGSKAGLSNSMLPARTIKSVCPSAHDADDANEVVITKDEKQKGDNDKEDDADDDDDDNNQVLPVWPSRLDAAALKTSLVQHQVYSLKDYSQVAAPTEIVATSNASVSGRLLKSMSQDRKMDPKTKRLSENVITGAGHSSLYPSESSSSATNSRRRNQTIVPAANLSMGPATSINSLLPQNKNSTLLGESRIDRMRKLFVSPLSLRGSTGASGSKSSHPSSAGARLSLQAGANMLNKPHHLMHAMYRNRVVIGHNRRSPMRQKQSKIKGFRVYGCPLGMANTMYPITCFGRAEIYKQQSVPYILARLCNYIEENSSQLTHEGIFRVSGNARLMDKLKTLFDHLGDAPLESESVDVATSASMLKMYLRELPEPLIPTRMNYYFFTLAKKYSSYLSKNNFHGSRASDNLKTSGQSEASSVGDTQSSVERQRLAFLRDLTKLIRKLPIDNYNLLKYLTCFLHRVALKQQSNKMSAEALGIVFGPNVFRIRNESYKGLKEQELSNQIMASIITNYKHIFDCELTDPLGNLVSSNENPNVNPEQVPEVISQSKSPDIRETNVSKNETRSMDIDASSSSIASTSANVEVVKFIEQSQCPKHGHHVKYQSHSNDASKIIDDSQFHEEDFDEDNVGDDDVDADTDGMGEDEDCDDESYSPSSGSESYCSYLASGSVDSTYEGDIEPDQYDDDVESDSSSECVSETSYTPSSSHSASNAAGMSSSNFSSTPSLTGANQDEDFLADVNDASQSGRPCRVCKRRESAQLEANKLREQMASMTVEDSPPVHNDDQPIESAAKCVKLDHPKPTRAQNRSSTKKRKIDVTRRAETAAKDDSDTAATKTSSDLALDQKSVLPKLHSEEKLARPHQHQPRATHRQNVLRRRSSSASSLFRITNRYSHAARKKSSARDERHPRSRVHSDRKRYNDSRGYSRKSRNKSHLFKKLIDNNSRLAQNYGQQTNASSSKSPNEWKKGDFFAPELFAMNLPTEVRKDLVWNYVSSSLLNTPECDRFFQLRSYNSDETLLRSQDVDTELIETSKNKRRFSGQELMQTNNESILVAACPQFCEIYESFEGEQSMDFKSIDCIEEELHGHSLIRSDASGAVKSSVISLLSDQMTNFKHSALSLDGETDPIAQQLKVLKDLIRVLRKILSYSSSHGLAQETCENLVKLVGANLEPDNLTDSDTARYVDHITETTTAIVLDSIKRCVDSDTPKVDDETQNRLMQLLSATVANLKKKYNNLKYIREHYYRHHFKQQDLIEDISSGSKSMQKSPSEHEMSGSSKLSESTSPDKHAMLEASSDQEISIGSALNTPKFISSRSHKTSAAALDESNKSNASQTKELERIGTSTCKFGSLCPVEFVFNVEKQLASRRVSGARLVKLDDMSPAQLQSEKVELQKNLLRYEHWFGRPTTRSESNLVGHLYERYRAIKIIKQRKQVLSD